MINRILCFMWGHQFEKIFGAVSITYGDGCKFVSDIAIHKCKHCGKRDRAYCSRECGYIKKTRDS